MKPTIKGFDLLDPHTSFFNIRNIKRVDPIMALLVIGLAAAGLAVLYSASRSTSIAPEYSLRLAQWPYYQRQGLFLLAGILLALFFMCLEPRFLVSIAPAMYVAFIVLLVLVILFGTSVKGGQRWLPVGPLRLQPSEQTKIVMIYMLAWYFSMVKERIRKFHYLLAAFAIAGLPAALILKQPSLGTAMSLIPLVFVMAYAAGCKGWHLALLISGGLLVVPTVYDHLEPYQQARLLSFIYPSDSRPAGPGQEPPEPPWQVRMLRHVGMDVPKADPQGIGWQTRQSKITIGSGGLYGKGFTQGTQTMLHYLPEHHTDFIFSVLAEEKGFIGVVVVVALFAAFLFRGLQFAKDCPDMAGTLLGVGAVTLLAFHVFVNIAITSGLMPVTGIPLPFLSYGGNFYLTTMMSVGMLLNIPVRKQLFD